MYKIAYFDGETQEFTVDDTAYENLVEAAMDADTSRYSEQHILFVSPQPERCMYLCALGRDDDDHLLVDMTATYNAEFIADAIKFAYPPRHH